MIVLPSRLSASLMFVHLVIHLIVWKDIHSSGFVDIHPYVWVIDRPYKWPNLLTKHQQSGKRLSIFRYCRPIAVHCRPDKSKTPCRLLRTYTQTFIKLIHSPPAGADIRIYFSVCIISRGCWHWHDSFIPQHGDLTLPHTYQPIRFICLLFWLWRT